MAGVALLLTLRAASTDFSPLTLATTSARVGQAYNAILTYSSPATWSLAGGSLPPGLAMNTEGLISGTPTQAGTYTFVVRARPSGGTADTRSYSIMVDPPAAYGYETRANTLIQQHIDSPWPPMDNEAGPLYFATASLWQRQNTSVANGHLAQYNMSDILERRNCLFCGMMFRAYFLYYSSSSFFPGRLSEAAENNLVNQMWRYSNQVAELAEANNSKLWDFDGSENLDFTRKVNVFLAAQVLKDKPDYKDRVYLDGGKAIDYYNRYRAFWSTKLDEMAKRGLFIEAWSPTYIGYDGGVIFNLYQFAEDPLIRKKAEMVLDLIFADYAQNQLKNVSGSGKSRAYHDKVFDGRGDSIYGFADLLYGSGYKKDNHSLYLATSGYFPPDFIPTMAGDYAGRGSYEFTSRRPATEDPERSVLHYSYVTPDFIFGSGLPGYKVGLGYVGASASWRWYGIIFNTDTGSRVFPQICRQRACDAWNAFYAVQKKGAWIAFPNPSYADKPLHVFFAHNLDVIDEEDGWLFVKEGNAFLAVRPQVGGYSWLTTNKNKDSDADNRFIQMTDSSSPLVFEAARATQFGGDFAAFKSKIKSNPRSFTDGVLNYTSSENHRLTINTAGGRPRIDGVSLEYLPAKVWDSPFINSDFGSGIINITYKDRSLLLDFSDPNNPRKILDSPAPASAPTIDTVNPASGPVEGGTNVTISGGNFVAGATVHFNFAPASSVTVVNASMITAVSPSVPTAGVVNVVVTNPDGQRAVKTNIFTYTTGDSSPPSTHIAAPADDSTVTGNVTLSAGASDNTGVAKVEFYLDGTGAANKLGEGTFTQFGWLLVWDSRGVSNGTHTVSSKAYDTAGNSAVSSSITVQVNNSPVLRNEDINQDGVVNLLDFSLLASKFGQTTDPGRADINRDGVVNLLDFSLLAAQFGK